MSDQDLAVTITQEELKKIATLRREIAWQRKELHRLEQNVLALVATGATFERGGYFTAYVGQHARGARLYITEHGYPVP